MRFRLPRVRVRRHADADRLRGHGADAAERRQERAADRRVEADAQRDEHDAGRVRGDGPAPPTARAAPTCTTGLRNNQSASGRHPQQRVEPRELAHAASEKRALRRTEVLLDEAQQQPEAHGLRHAPARYLNRDRARARARGPATPASDRTRQDGHLAGSQCRLEDRPEQSRPRRGVRRRGAPLWPAWSLKPVCPAARTCSEPSVRRCPTITSTPAPALPASARSPSARHGRFARGTRLRSG